MLGKNELKVFLYTAHQQCNRVDCWLLTAEDVWFFCDLYLKFIPPINIWNDLSLFSKYLREPFLRTLRSKDDRGWILRLRPQNFAIISESLATNHEKVRQTSLWQTVPKFWFIRLFYCSSKTYSCMYCKKTKHPQQWGVSCEVHLFFWYFSYMSWT